MLSGGVSFLWAPSLPLCWSGWPCTALASCQGYQTFSEPLILRYLTPFKLYGVSASLREEDLCAAQLLPERPLGIVHAHVSAAYAPPFRTEHGVSLGTRAPRPSPSRSLSPFFVLCVHVCLAVSVRAFSSLRFSFSSFPKTLSSHRFREQARKTL